MKTMLEYLETLEIEVPKGEVNGAWFKEHYLPMIVRCTDCGMTMVLFSAMIDDEGLLYCESCAQIFEADEAEKIQLELRKTMYGTILKVKNLTTVMLLASLLQCNFGLNLISIWKLSTRHLKFIRSFQIGIIENIL